MANLPGDLKAHAFPWTNGAMQDLGTLLHSDGFSWGLAIFTLASVLCSLAPRVHFLIAARMFQNQYSARKPRKAVA